MISLENLKIVTPLQKLLKNLGDLGKLIVSKGFNKLPKVQLIAQSGHTGHHVLKIIKYSTHLQQLNVTLFSFNYRNHILYFPSYFSNPSFL